MNHQCQNSPAGLSSISSIQMDLFPLTTFYYTNVLLFQDGYLFFTPLLQHFMLQVISQAFVACDGSAFDQHHPGMDVAKDETVHLWLQTRANQECED
jgi:hypothetical protein